MKNNSPQQPISLTADSHANLNLTNATRTAFSQPATLAKSTGLWAKLTPETVEGSTFALLQTATMPGVKGAYRLLQGEDHTGVVLADVIVDTAKGVAAGYATSTLGTGVATAATKVGLGGITKWNAHMAIAASILQSGKLFTRYLTKDIDAEQLLDEVNRTVITGTASFYYGSLGQTVIPIPVVGALIGSTVGYFTGNILYQSGLLSLGVPLTVKHAENRRKHIEDLCLHAIPVMQRNREELQALISQHFTEQTGQFNAAFSAMDSVLAERDPDAYLKQLEILCNVLGKGLPFRSFQEFDEFMSDGSKTFEL